MQGGTFKYWPVFAEGLFGGDVNKERGLCKSDLLLIRLTEVCLAVKLLPVPVLFLHR